MDQGNNNGNQNGNGQQGNQNGNGQQGNQNGNGQQGSSSQVTIPSTAPAGGLTILSPPQTATSYFKIAPSNTITFVWNFTDVIIFPTSLTVSAICDNGNTYAVGPSDGKIDGHATSVEWDLWSFQQAHPTLPLAATSYQLHIWGDQGPGAARAPGILQENSALRFAMYSPRPYTPLQSTCLRCNINRTFLILRHRLDMLDM